MSNIEKYIYLQKGLKVSNETIEESLQESSSNNYVECVKYDKVNDIHNKRRFRHKIS